MLFHLILPIVHKEFYINNPNLQIVYKDHKEQLNGKILENLRFYFPYIDQNK